MSVEPLSREERLALVMAGRSALGIEFEREANERYEATVQAETLRADAAEALVVAADRRADNWMRSASGERAERLVEVIRWARGRARLHDDVFLAQRLTAVLTADEARGGR